LVFRFLTFFSRIQASYDGDLILIQKLIKDGAKVNYIHLQRDKIEKVNLEQEDDIFQIFYLLLEAGSDPSLVIRQL
jgi:predicted nuclease of restriction endonuclease-like (RecB) superfamily